MNPLRNLSIITKLTLTFVLFAALILVGVGLQAYLSGRSALEKAVISDLESIANEKQAAFDQWLHDRLNLIVSITSFPAYRARVFSLIHDKLEADARKTLQDQIAQELEGFTGPSGNYSEIMIVEASQGQVIVSTQLENQGKFNEDRPFFIEGMKGPFVQNVVYSLNEGSPVLIVSAPMKADNGNVIAVLAARLKLDQMNEIVTRHTEQHKTDDEYLVNPSNLFVTQPRFITDPAVLQRGIHTEQVNRCLAGNSGVLTGDNYRGVPVLAAFHWIPDHRLCLLVEINQSEAFESVQAFERGLVLVGGVILLAALLLAFWLARSITRPLQTLKQGVEDFGKGQLDLRISEISQDELGRLAQEFNRMADSLSQKDAQIHAYASGLEQKVVERTAQLVASEERYRTVADFTYDWEYWNAPTGELLYVSPSCERITGYRAEEFVETPDLLNTIVYPDDRQLLEEHTSQIRINNNGDGLHETDFRIVRQDGEVRWIGHICQSIRRADGTDLGRRATNRDITERKIAEEQIRKLNRVLSVLSDTNQAIVRIRDPRMLFESVSHIAVEKGGFALVWIGLVDPATGKIIPSAHAGNSTGYLDKLVNALNDISQGQNPILGMLMNGQRCLCNDLENDPLLAFLRPEIDFLGLKSSVALPLQVAGVWRGFINIYSSETGFFDDEELKLLDEMAMDLSYSMEFADQEVERRRAEEALKNNEALLTEVGRMGKIGGWEFFVDTLAQVWTEEVYRIHEVDRTYNPTVGAGIDFYAPASRPIIDRAVQRAIDYGEPFDLELEFITAKGNHRWVHTIAKTHQENGKTKKVSGMFQDITEKKRAEEAISNLAKFPAENPNPILRIQNDGTLLYANELSFSILQDWKLEIGRPVPTDLMEMVFETLTAGIGKIIDTEQGHRIISFSIVPLVDAGYANLYGQDVTDRRQSEQALSLSEELYRTLVEQASDGIFLASQDGRYIEVNSAGSRMLGYTREEILQLSMRDMTKHSQVEPLRFKELQEGKTLLSEREMIRKDGALLSVEISARQLPDGRLQGIVRDITERKQAVAALRESEERLSAFFASGIFGTLFGDVFGNIKQANDEFLRIIGYTREDLNAGRVRWTDLTPPEFLPLDEIGIAQAKEHGSCTPYEKQYIRKDGSVTWVLVGFVLVGPQKDDSIAFILDLNDLKQKEAEIQNLNTELEQRVVQRTQQLEAANKELEAFAYSVSHDLRAPLRAIDGFSRIIVDDYADKLDSEGTRLLKVIRNNTAKMDQLITDLLALSRATRIEMKFSWIDMAILANSIYHEVSSPEVREQITFSVSAIPDAYGDPNLLRQVWTNLLTNAIKYSGPKEERRIEVGGYRENEMNVYFVKDNGVGFNPEYTHKLFGVFQRLHKTEDFEGTGVGLAIVQRTIQRHGGKAWAEGQLNQGATFYFSLPSIPGD